MEINHARKCIYNLHQVSFRVGETVKAKHALKCHVRTFGMQILNYHADNGVFTSNLFKEDLQQKSQSFDLSGMGAIITMEWQNKQSKW